MTDLEHFEAIWRSEDKPRHPRWFVEYSIAKKFWMAACAWRDLSEQLRKHFRSWDGDRLLKKCAQRKMSLDELAGRLNVGICEVLAWTKGKIPRGDHCIKLCEVLETKLSCLMSSKGKAG